MNKHIKTANEIYIEICNICCDVNNEREKKWVSLDWLKKQIKMEKGDTDNNDDFCEGLKWVLLLLKEES